MALIKCPECIKDVSSEAWDCPNCGKKLRTPKRGFFGNLFKGIALIFHLYMAYVLFVFFAGVGTALTIYETQAEKETAVIGMMSGAGPIIIAWVIGGLFLGLFVSATKPKRD